MHLSDLELKQFIEQKGINDTKLSVKNLINIYKDNWRYIILDEIARQFTDASYEKLRPLVTTELNLLKRITNETALVYKKNAQRKAQIPQKIPEVKEGEKPAEQIFKEDANYESIIGKTNLNSIMKQVNKFTKLTNQTMLKVIWRNRKIEFDLLTFDNVEIFTDDEDWTKIIAIKYFIDLRLNSTLDDSVITRDTTNPIPTNNNSSIAISEQQITEFTTMFLWTLEDKDSDTKEYKTSFVRTFKLHKGEMNEVEKENNPYFIDGLPVLPFVFFPNKTPHASLLDFTTGNDLIDGNINTALNMIHINNIMKFQSYILMWIKASDKKSFPKSWDIDMSSILALLDTDGNTEVGSVDLQAKIRDIWLTLIERVILLYGSRGIPPSAIRIEGTPESGIKAHIDKQALLEAREDDIEIYREKENDLFEIIRAVNNEHNTLKISEDAELSIDFAEITFPTTRQEDAAADSIEITNNTLTGWQILQRKNPDLSDDEAKEKYSNNKDFNSNSLGGLTTIEQPSNVTEEEEEDA